MNETDKKYPYYKGKLLATIATTCAILRLDRILDKLGLRNVEVEVKTGEYSEPVRDDEE